MRAGIVTLNITIAETPEARKEASEEARPACAKRSGAYLMMLVGLCMEGVQRVAVLELNDAYIENAVDAAELLHAKQECCQTSTRAYIPGEDIKEAVFVRGVWGTCVRGSILFTIRVRGVDKVVSFNSRSSQFNLRFLTLCMANA